MAEASQIICGMTTTNWAVIFSHCHIENPMQSVFNAPMGAHCAGKIAQRISVLSLYNNDTAAALCHSLTDNRWHGQWFRAMTRLSVGLLAVQAPTTHRRHDIQHDHALAQDAQVRCWPKTTPFLVAKALIMCSVDCLSLRLYERRSVLPSTATTSLSVSFSVACIH